MASECPTEGDPMQYARATYILLYEDQYAQHYQTWKTVSAALDTNVLVYADADAQFHSSRGAVTP
jgi:hypothetical protein